jgi:hypothetical protein
MANIVVNNSSLKDNDTTELSEEETKQYLTPFAFKLDKSLFGLPLASPAKRGIALLIDFSLIAVLSDISGGILALAIAGTLYYLGNKKRAQRLGKIKGRKRRAIMRTIASIIFLLVVITQLPTLLEYANVNNSENETKVATIVKPLSLSKSLVLTGVALSAITDIKESECQLIKCWQSELNSLAKKIAKISVEGSISVTNSQLENVFTDISKEVNLAKIEQQQLAASMLNSYQQEFAHLEGRKEPKVNMPVVETPKLKGSENNNAFDTLHEDGSVADISQQESNKPVYSIIEWAKGIIEDLGLGFGWATFYFTAFIAIGKGQTIGKKLLGIKVLQLDGTPLSLWDSFGRYGGYGAGVATGLLGFLQIYWNPNRQAIHDQISATVVIDVNKARLVKELKN